MPDLKTRYLGMDLRNPIVPSSSPLCEDIDNLRRMEDAGAAAVVLPSLFEEEIDQESRALDHYLESGAESYAEATTYFAPLVRPNGGPERYLGHIMRAKAALDIPVIASLNGTSAGGWTRFARFMQDAGADALELNLYHVASDPVRSSADIEAGYLDLVRAVARAIRIPFAVKLGPDFTGLAHFAAAASLSGADGLVLFNRFYQPDIDLERLEVIPGLEPSRSSELPQRLRWIAMLHGRIDADLAVTGGVHTGEDVLKCVMAGASIAMMTSALLVRGIGHLHTVLRDMKAWMVQSEYESIAGMRGSMSHRSVARPSALERANYMRALQSYTVPGRSG